jgi:hypothetical protein
MQLVKPSVVFSNHLLIMGTCQKSKDLVAIRKLCCQEFKHATSFLERVASPRCFDGTYSLQGLVYKVQHYNMECHCNGDCLAHMRYGGLRVVLEVVWLATLEFPLLLCW